MTAAESMTVGRFAPTPSGPLHMGSLVTALASYCQARANQGRWLLRIEDVDTPRVITGSADDILFTLEAFGFEWDGDVLYQSDRFAAYEEALQLLLQQELVYPCECSRKSLLAQDLASGPLGYIYPALCRHKKLKRHDFSLRLNVEQAGEIGFSDLHYDPYKLDVSRDVGDVVLKRVDGIYAYHLAVVIDDAWQQVDHIVRGADLLEVTCLHLYLYRLLDLQPPQYLHIPLMKNAEGKKLSKQTGAEGLDIKRASALLLEALAFLGQPLDPALTEAKPDEVLAYAITNWDSQLIDKT